MNTFINLYFQVNLEMMVKLADPDLTDLRVNLENEVKMESQGHR